MVHQHGSRITRPILLFCFLGILVLQGCSLFEKQNDCSDLTVEGQACIKRMVACGTKCFKPGLACDPAHPAAKCTDTTNAQGQCECKCL